MGLSLFSNITHFLKDCFFPLQCLFCNKEGSLCCSDCLATIGWNDSRCPFCATATENYQTCFQCRKKHSLSGCLTFFDYDDPKVKQIISALKFQGWYAIADSLTNVFVARVVNLGIDSFSSVVIPAPQRIESFKSRGYNQAAILANTISREFGLRQKSLLTISKHAAQHSQKKLNRWDITSRIRLRRDLAETFENAIVVDDLLTTGATLEGCARALHNAGIPNVFGITLARQYRHFTN